MNNAPVSILSFLIMASMVPLLIKNNRTPAYLGHNQGRLAPMPKTPNAVSSQTDDPDKQVAPLPYAGSRDASRDKVVAALSALGNAQIEQNQPDYLHAVVTSPLMRFRDDVEFYFDDQAGVVHYRSQSRSGYSDMGLNRARYEKLRDLYTG